MCHKDDMANEARLYELLMSIKPEGLTENAWVSRAQVSRNFFQAVKNGSRPRSDTLEKVIIAAGLTPAQFYDLEGGKKAPPQDDGSPKRGLPFQRRDEPLDLPLMGTVQGSDMEVEADGKVTFVERMDLDMADTVEYLRRPSSLANRREVYAITVIGNSMADRFEDGDPAYVDPARQARNGDYVVVQLVRHDSDGDGRLHIALLKKLVRKTSTYIELYQKNPECTFTIPLKEVHAIHRVVPWREIVFF
jgi:SOS-response transcriptional repressor LexA